MARIKGSFTPEQKEKSRNRMLENNPFKGKKHSQKTRDSMRKAWGNRRLVGVSLETRAKLSIARKGNKNSYKGGKTPPKVLIRMSVEYSLWRTAVFERDNYTCVWCGIRGGKLNADHIKRFSDFPELRVAIDNGRTLCVPCHRTTDTYGMKGRKKNK